MKKRKNSWVYDKGRNGWRVAVTLHGKVKIVGKVKNYAFKNNNTEIAYYLVQPLMVFGRFKENMRWFSWRRVEILCQPGKQECANCNYKFICWTIREGEK